jgi:hypothetical protein
VAVELKDDYPVLDARDVRLSVSLGEGQTGLVSVYLGGVTIGRAPAPLDVRIGSGSDVRDKLLEVRTIVNDVRSQTNRMSVIYQLTGGISPLECVSRGEVAEEYAALDFTAVFTLV